MATVAFAVLQASVLLLVLLGGGLFPGPVCATALLTCSAWALGLVRRHRAPAADPVAGAAFPWLEIAMATALLLVILTALPLPPLLDPFIGALRRQQNRVAQAFLEQGASLGLFDDARPWFALSRNRVGTLRFVLLLASAFGAMMLSASLPARWRVKYLAYLAGVGAIVAVGGHISQWWIPQGDTLWWTLPVAHVLPGPVGCFVNRNHFGGFVAMLTPVTLVLAGHAFRRRRRFSGAVLLVMAIAMVFALFTSLSRGAVLAFAGASVALSLVLAARRSFAAAIGSLVAVAALAALVLAASPHARDRLAGLKHPLSIPSVQNRLMEWRESLRVWPSYPLIGAGANALRMVYPQARRTSVARWLVFAENEYVQLVAEGGVIGVAVAGAWLWAVRRRLRDGSEAVPPVVAAAAGGAVMTAAIHGAFDFALHLPLYAVVLASLAGLCLSPPGVAPQRRLAFALAPAALGLLASAAIGLSAGTTLRRLDTDDFLGSASPVDLRRALISAPTSWHAWYYLGHGAWLEGNSRHDTRLLRFGASLMTQAAWLDPQNYRLWYALGEARLTLKDYARADAAFARARQLRPWRTPPPYRRDR